MKYLSPSGYSPLEDESVELKTVTDQRDEDEEFNDQLQSPEVSIVTSESSLQIFLEMLFPFIFGTLFLLKWGASSSFGPNSAWGCKEMPTIGTAHPSLLQCIK